MEKIPYVREMMVLSTGAAEIFMLDNPMITGQWLFIQHDTMEDETNNFTGVLIGQGRDATSVHWWEEEANPVLGVLYWAENMFYVPEGHRVIIRWDGTTAGDTLRAYLDGYTSPKVLSKTVFRRSA